MKAIVQILFLIVFSFSGFAQGNLEIEREINEQLWKPFLRASSGFDGNSFMALQSKDFIQVSLDDHRIYGRSMYEESILPNFERIKKEGKVQRTTEMRFISRIVSDDLAYETGYFKGTTTFTNGETRVRYSLFTIILRKENDAWKILVDADTNHGGTITEGMFAKAKPIIY